MRTLIRFSTALAVAAALLHAAARFDNLVRDDFFAGFAGNQEALARAMKVCEDTLKENPSHPEAMVWHGGGTLFLSGQAFQKGEYAKGGQLWESGLKEMADAVALAPNNVAVLIPRGATLLAVSASAPPAQGRPLLEQGVADYSKVRELQKPYFNTLSAHSQGELLFGLADGYKRLERTEEARQTFEALLAIGKTSGHEKQAQQYLAGQPYSKSPLTCTGCHSSK